MGNNDVKKSWERFLNPTLLRNNLIVASLYITAFEILKDSIIDRIKNFFADSIEYETDVLSKNKSILYASLFWLKNMSAINDHDLEKFKKMKETRNQLVHEMPEFITIDTSIKIDDCFLEMMNLLEKIEVWWIKEVEASTNPYLVESEINDKEIEPGAVIILQWMYEMALGSEKQSIH